MSIHRLRIHAIVTSSMMTMIVATISPSILCCEETLSTLNYAQRAHGIKNKNVESTMRMIQGAPGGGMVGASPSKGAGGQAFHQQSWQALEMKLAYMEWELTEAQARLSEPQLEDLYGSLMGVASSWALTTKPRPPLGRPGT